jgi:hypothetical protein
MYMNSFFTECDTYPVLVTRSFTSPYLLPRLVHSLSWLYGLAIGLYFYRRYNESCNVGQWVLHVLAQIQKTQFLSEDTATG